MTQIIYSQHPERCVNVLNGEASILVVKSIPHEVKEWFKDTSKPFPEMEVFIYAAKGTPYLFQSFPSGYEIQYYKNWHITHDNGDSECFSIGDEETLNGKVVAKFTLKKVDFYGYFDEPTEDEKVIDEQTGQTYLQAPPLAGKGVYITSGEGDKTGLTYDEIFAYSNGKNLYGLHITKLEVFDKPKELGEFYYYKGYTQAELRQYNHLALDVSCMTRAPQSWQYCVYENPVLTDMPAIADTNKLADNLKTMERLKKESEEK